MPGQVDLHIHSNKSSDGDFSPFHICRMAEENGFRAISITDHDTVAAYPEALRFGEEMDVEIIPSIELTTVFDKREFHVLLPFINWKSKILAELISRASKGRIIEAKGRVRKLRELGFDIKWKEVAKMSKSALPMGVTIAKLLLNKAEKTKIPSLEKYFSEENRIFAPYRFYEDYFVEGKPAWVPKQNLDLLEVLRSAPRIEAVPVLSHPGAYFQRTSKEDLLILKENGLEGIEVYTSYHDPPQTELYSKIARELDLVATAGSDFHGRIKPHIPFGFIKEGEYTMVEELRRRR